MSLARRSSTLALVLWVVLAPAVLCGCATHAADKRILQYLNGQGFGRRYTGNAQEQDYVTIGDTISFIDTFNPEVRGTSRVGIDGTIELPEAGAVSVAGLTRSELETYLTQKLSPYYLETDVKVSIAAGPSKVYYVVGQVPNPGPRPYTGDTTIFDAVTAASPREYSANLGRVRLIRADPRDPLIVTTNISDMWKYGDSTYNIQVHEFDIIYIPPTLMQQVADFVSGLLVPLTSTLRSVIQVIFFFDGYGYGNQVGRQRGFF